MDPKEQSAFDKATIKVRLIENAILVTCGEGWLSFETWERASQHIAARVAALKAKRAVSR